MKKQEYLLKKFVKAHNAAEALALDSETEVHEVHLVADTLNPTTKLEPAIGFTILTEDEFAEAAKAANKRVRFTVVDK